MAFVLTNTSLTIELQNYFQRRDEDFINSIPMFTMLGERNVARKLKILGLKIFIDSQLIAGNNLLQKPTRWLNNASFDMGVLSPLDPVNRNTRKQILQRDRLFGEIYWPNPALTGEPKYYADNDYYTWVVYPTPDLNYSCRIGYFQFPTFIDDTVNTNFLTANAPDVLFFAVALEAAIYLEDDQHIPILTQKFEQAVANLGEEDVKRIWDEFSVR